ncbi:MAG: helix-turn-helix domain-containing protein [Bacteriovorax sp.]
MIKKNYTMMMAGKERVFSVVKLTESRTGKGFILSHSELERISFLVCKEICFSKDLVTLEELEFLRNLFELNQNEVASGIGVKESTLSKWKINKKDNGFDLMESIAIKAYFTNKLAAKIEIPNLFDSSIMLNIFIGELINNFNNHSTSSFEKVRKLEELYVDTCFSLEFETILPTEETEKIVINSQEFNFNSSGYLEELEKNEEPNANSESEVESENYFDFLMAM